MRDHLAECPACCETVESLRRSLHLAEAIWQDNLQHAETATGPARRRMAHRLYYAIAAGIVLATGTLLMNAVHGPPKSNATYADIERQVARASAAARLLAATQMLAGCEGTEPLVERQRRYILDNYGDTPAAAALNATNHLTSGVTDND